MKIIIDNGHGAETPGKRSPDGSVLEYAYTRRMATALAAELRAEGFGVHILVPEQKDVPLAERVRRANGIRDAVALVSLHLNAAGSDGQWHTARGFSCFVAPNASQQSRLLGRILTEEAERNGMIGNRCVPPQKVWVQNLAICRQTVCPAVLTESLFQDNPGDVATLLSPDGFDALINLHKTAILNYLNLKC